MAKSFSDLTVRLRRLRQHPRLRDLVRQVYLQPDDLVLPIFVCYGRHIREPILSLPGHYRWSVDRLREVLQPIEVCGIPAVILFVIPEHKDAQGSIALNPKGVAHSAIQEIKSILPNHLLIVDLCLCQYTCHGHCGVLHSDAIASTTEQLVDNDRTLVSLSEQAVSLAQTGADVIAPSGMMDGVVAALRRSLDQSGFNHIPILSYTLKYASAFYGPFRSAVDSMPQVGDRRTYQADPANLATAQREVQLDVEEGADMLMVKPAMPYLDMIYRVKQSYPQLPVGAYQVSGEFAMIKAAAHSAWIDESAVMWESLVAIKRSGADFIISYYALEAARVLSA